MTATTSPAATSCDCNTSCATQAPSPPPSTARFTSIGKALRLEYLTVGWNLAEGIIAVIAAIMAGSVAILGFGIDSFVECSSALVMIWRLRAERAHRLDAASIEALEHRARKLIAVSLFLLGAYVTFDAAQTLWLAEQPSFSVVGVVLLVLSITVMQWLARAKRRLATELGSRALEADAIQTTACWWLSIAALVGVGLNGAFGWWWADPVAGLVIAGLIVREGREAWLGKECC